MVRIDHWKLARPACVFAGWLGICAIGFVVDCGLDSEHAAAAESEVGAADAHKQLQALVARSCSQCHGDTKPKGNLQLEPFGEEQWTDYGLLDEVLTQINDGAMPPEDAKVKLTDDDRKLVAHLLTSRLEAIEGAQLSGTLNRLTRREWCDTLEDLTGLAVEKQYELPIDSSHAMTRLGEHQLLTPLAMRQYQTVAERYIDEAILDKLPEVATTVVDLTDAENQIGNSSNESQPWGILSHNDRTVITINSPVKTFAAEGEYEFVFDYYFTSGADLKSLPKGQTPKPIEVDPNRHFGRFGGSGEILSKPYTHNLDGEKFHPSGKVQFYRYDEPLRVRLTKGRKTVQFVVQGNGNGPRWVFTSVAIRGPLGRKYPASHEKIFGDASADGDLDDCKRVLDSLARRLFRRPVNVEIMEPYYAMAEARYHAGGNLYSATEASLKAMVVSPYFLFKELGDKPALDDHQIATRLSYFLWNTAPDERLMSLADAGKLTDPAVRRAEAERLLADPDTSDRFVRLFTKQWLGLDRFDDFAPNAAYIEGKNLAPLRPSIEEEPYALFATLLTDNLSARNFIDSDFVVWDKALFGYYNNEKQTGIRSRDRKDDGFAKYDLTKATDEARMRHGGLVCMPIVMCMTTDGETTQPFLRGAWVITHLFGKKLEPPDSVPALEVNLANVDKPKEILRLHKQDPSCYACHVKMDYMGLALENFDVMGRWQSNYLFPVIEGNKFKLVTKDPVDSLAESPAGQPIDGIVGLKQHLLDREDEVLRNLTEKLFAYALGREARYKDRAAIDRLMKTAKANDYRLRDMILEITAADSLAHR
jgi:mono/diheme cytochrome c family protein